MRPRPFALNLFNSSLLPFVLILISLQNGGTSAKKITNYAPLEMTRYQVLNYFRSILRTKISTHDKVNEEVYSGDTFPEDLYHNIGHLMAHQRFIHYLTRTKNITDKTGHKGNQLLGNYPAVPNSKCSPATVFDHSTTEILELLETDKARIYSDMDTWHADNMMTPYNQICNRFRGLTCQYRRGKHPEKGPDATCQCDGNRKNVEFFSSKKMTKAQRSRLLYPDGCYIRPWRPCQHLSLDYAFRSDYYDTHTSLYNQRSLLAQMSFPVARTHRCKQGSYCMDLVPGMNKPVCWCNLDSDDKDCLTEFRNPRSTVIPLGAELAAIRRNFAKLFIPVEDSRSRCYSRYNDLVERIANATRVDPTETDVVARMRELTTSYKEKGIRICDFRRSFYCDSATGTCAKRWTCDPGKTHLGKGVCATNNGFPCHSNKECLPGTKCKQLGTAIESVCSCEKGYGPKCEQEQASMFGSLFRPIISGFSGDDFNTLQETIESILKAWEKSMTQDEGEVCTSSSEKPSMEIVSYFGNLQEYQTDKGDRLLKDIQKMLRDTPGPKLCSYTNFLHCDPSEHKCIPMMGSKLVPTSSPNGTRIAVEVPPGQKCDGSTLPKIFQNLVEISCSNGYICMKEGDQMLCQLDCNSLSAPVEACSRLKRAYNAFETIQGKTSTMPPTKNSPSPRRKYHPHNSGNKVTNVFAEDLESTVTSTHPHPTSSPTETPISTPISTPTETPISTPTETPTETPISTKAPPKTRQPVEPPSKFLWGEECTHSEDQANSNNAQADFKICDGELFLHCDNNVCKCLPPLTYSEYRGRCVIPIGKKCRDLQFPSYIKYAGDAECEFGLCVRDSSGVICRPPSDNLLILVDFNKTREYTS